MRYHGSTRTPKFKADYQVKVVDPLDLAEQAQALELYATIDSLPLPRFMKKVILDKLLS